MWTKNEILHVGKLGIFVAILVDCPLPLEVLSAHKLSPHSFRIEWSIFQVSPQKFKLEFLLPLEM